jgi:hypothetical protein
VGRDVGRNVAQCRVATGRGGKDPLRWGTQRGKVATAEATLTLRAPRAGEHRDALPFGDGLVGHEREDLLDVHRIPRCDDRAGQGTHDGTRGRSRTHRAGTQQCLDEGELAIRESRDDHVGDDRIVAALRHDGEQCLVAAREGQFPD